MSLADTQCHEKSVYVFSVDFVYDTTGGETIIVHEIITCIEDLLAMYSQ